MTDPIKAALDLARDELLGEGISDWDGNMPMQATAAAIAAFLDALPPGMIRWGSDAAGYDPDDKPTLKQLAAAIRRAGGAA